MDSRSKSPPPKEVLTPGKEMDLFGSKNIERVLIFLFVNGKCYGNALHKSFGIPLTPVQKALARLEKGGVLMSDYEGKTRVFRFNPSFPLLEELQQLLKKSYTLLPTSEKKNYRMAMQQADLRLMGNERGEALRIFWEKLLKIKQLKFHARSQSVQESGWNGAGIGTVVVTKEGSHVAIFQESGTWKNRQGEEIRFNNVFRWTLDPLAWMISLEHLRLGVDHPVFLFHLAPLSLQTLASIDSHLCEGDVYFGRVFFDAKMFRMHWRVIGPKKNEEIDYFYS